MSKDMLRPLQILRGSLKCDAPRRYLPDLQKDTGHPTWEFPKIRGTFLGVPIIRTIVFWGLYWGPLILGNYHMNSTITTDK